MLQGTSQITNKAGKLTLSIDLPASFFLFKHNKLNPSAPIDSIERATTEFAIFFSPLLNLSLESHKTIKVSSLSSESNLQQNSKYSARRFLYLELKNKIRG